MERAPRASGQPWWSSRAEYNRRGRQGYLQVEIEKDPWNLIHLRAACGRVALRRDGPVLATRTAYAVRGRWTHRSLGDGGPGLDRRRERGNPAVSLSRPGRLLGRSATRGS